VGDELDHGIDADRLTEDATVAQTAIACALGDRASDFADDPSANQDLFPRREAICESAGRSIV
jgi:hypothetical protein